MSKKIIQNVLIVLIIVLIIFIVWVVITRGIQDDEDDDLDVKSVEIVSLIDDVITFDVPSDWNIFYNGDPELVDDLDSAVGQTSIVLSVSSADNPVTYTDMNSGQIDFLLTDSDLLTQQFTDEQEAIDGQTFKYVQYDNFDGYVLDDFNENEPVSKGNSDGLVYYLKPGLDNPDWNLIIVKQSRGDSKFEEGVQMILDTLDFQYYEEYINDQNK